MNSPSERERAPHLLQRIERENLYASLLLIGESGFVRTLVLGVLRWRSRLDFVIGVLAKRSINRLDASVVEVLRLGLYQLLYMDVAPYAAVDETVGLTPKRARGFVNAILRGATRVKLPDRRPGDADSASAVLIERWTRMYGAERAARIAEADQELSYPDVLSLRGVEPPESVRSSSFPICSNCMARAPTSIAATSIRWMREARSLPRSRRRWGTTCSTWPRRRAARRSIWPIAARASLPMTFRSRASCR